ncbi:MAG: DUF3828 domain-containing protein [Reyranella sp.]|uniref:DUF3828 domain-containing protein n=1 Tax=Reyranella sp. TaxID=1929291 RepID=UPI001AC93909|nr:DUF3828 domain-containing protein [Reyranella sp.]MBN9089088.1 DUF3828 domain-containing protein [Reyranella sp.]
MGKRLRRRTLALALLAVPIAARAQSSTALDFLKSIYEPYKQAGFKGQPYWETERFFATELAQAIQRDLQEAKKRKEVPTLDGDPFIDAQAWSIASIGYAVSTGSIGSHAAAVVTLTNSGQPRQLAVFLIRTPRGWRIDDIVGRGGSSLRALYKLR